MKFGQHFWLCCICLFGSMKWTQNATSQVTFKNGGDYYALMQGDTYLTSFVFTEISAFQEGFCWVNKGDLYGYIDSSGHEICSFVYTDVCAFQNGFAAVSRDSALGFINVKGDEICELIYSRVSSFCCGLAGVQVDSLWTLIDTSGQTISLPLYQYPPMIFSQNFIAVSKNNTWGVIDKNGKEIYPFKYDLITKDGVGFIGNEKHYLGLL